MSLVRTGPPRPATQYATLGPPFLERGVTTFRAPVTESMEIDGTEFGSFRERADFPWLGVWEENHSRTHAPWNGRTMTRGLEFGVSPFPETRRRMIERGSLFGTPCCRWIGARSELTVRYRAAIGRTGAV